MGRLSAFLKRIPQRFWFIPAVYIAGAVVLAQLLVGLDRSSLPVPAPVKGFLTDVGVDGARALLSSVATFLGVAGTAFSITISVVSTASTTYGPRLVRNFMRDRKNQTVLGVLVATFVYTLLVLRTIHSATDDGSAFVPHLAVNFAIVLGVIDVILFVWFIHHIAESVQVETLSSNAKYDFERALSQNWIDPDDDRADRREPPVDGGTPLTLGRAGYLVMIDRQALARDLAACGAQLRVLKRPGDQVMAEEPVALAWPESAAEDAQRQMRDHIHVAQSRTTDQDLRFAEQQVVELAVRALSSGTNDPYTAINAIEQVTAGILTAVSRSESANALLDDDGEPRLYLRPIPVHEIVSTPFDHIRPYATGNALVLTALVDLAARVRAAAVDPSVAAIADRQVDTLLEVADLDPREHEALTAHIKLSRDRSMYAPPSQP
ncbi:DUF2254 domain-containing protein [Enemella sp. A6]|uniref:DUF2254 domain-containing protein n=1 Tax=Enemella sp. A6 TaxID=3440152 RepID=UPI003EBEC5A0